ncbi:MAG: TlpA disulfide reductase family protein [Bacteroidetes bacterium]|nr:TlpA disulfide reductase family protein [Bacteroidota bacterium]
MSHSSLSRFLINGKNKFCFIFTFFLLGYFSIHAENTATISGSIENAIQPAVTLTFDRLHLDKHVEVSSSVINNGRFQFTVQPGQGNLLRLSIDSFHLKLFAEPGDRIEVQMKNQSAGFSGTCADQNIFLNKFFDLFKNDFDDSIMQPKMLETGVDAFEMMIFENRKKQTEFFRNKPDPDFHREKFSSGFNTFIQNTINYRYWSLLFSYPIINANSNKGLTVNALPTVMLDVFTKVRLNNDSALVCEPYREFLKYYVIYFTSQANGFNKFNDFSVSADKKFTLAKDRLKEEAYKFWLAKFTMDECGRLSPFTTKKLYAALKEIDTEGKYTPVINEVCGERMSMKEEKKKEEKTNTPAGTVAPAVGNGDELDLTDVNGKHVSLKDFKGKVVYVDFWASWCGPCRKMMPYSKSLHENLTAKQKKQIVFLYISIDADPVSWKKAIQDLGIEGINVNSPGNWSAKVCKYFQVYSIPRYMIMNKKGDIVDFNAKRPADPAILDDLLKYTLE